MSKPLVTPQYAGIGPAAISVILLSAFLRLYQLSGESLWIDEGFSLRDSSSYHFLGDTRPFYFLILKAWRDLGADSIFMLRLPAALFGIASVYVFYLLGRRLMGRPTALLAAAFMAVSTLQITHSQEIRMYSLTVLLTLLAGYFLVLTLTSGRAWYVVPYAACAFASLVTFPLTVLVLVAHGVYAFLYLRSYRKGAVLIGGQLAVALAWVPWLMGSMQASTAYGEGYTAQVVEKPGVEGTITMMGRLFVGKWSETSGVPGLVLAAFSIGLIGLAVYGLRGVRRVDSGPAFAWVWLLVPVVGLVTMSHTLTNMWMLRYLIAASPAFYLLVAKGIHNIGSRRLAALAAVAVFSLPLVRLGLYYQRPMNPQWREVVAQVERNERPGDVIAVYYGGNQHVFGYHYDGRSEWAPIGNDDYAEEDFGKWDEARVGRLLAAGYPLQGKRLWLVLSHHTFRGGFTIINYFKARYRVVDHQVYHDVEFYLFDGGGRMIPEIPIRKAGH